MPSDHPNIIPEGDGIAPTYGVMVSNIRGLDNGLVKAAPSAEGLNAKSLPDAIVSSYVSSWDGIE